MFELRHYNLVDKILDHFDKALRTLKPPKTRPIKRAVPGNENLKNLDSKQKAEVAGLMRVNHAGEVCAQALYKGQALTAKKPRIKAQMLEAAEEETDHLGWCEQRLSELDSKPSLLNPFWYLNSFVLGALAGLLGDSYSLGFVIETEKQVSKHLQNHLLLLPNEDKKTKAILETMLEDEEAHALTALKIGGKELPEPLKKLMTLMAKIMTTTSYYI